MKARYLILALPLYVPGCGSLLQERLAVSAAQKAVAETPTDLPDLPPECHADVPHAPRVVGQDAPVALWAERGQKDLESASKRRCVDFYDGLRAAHAGRPH